MVATIVVFIGRFLFKVREEILGGVGKGMYVKGVYVEVYVLWGYRRSHFSYQCAP
jgi:hypothetical protein